MASHIPTLDLTGWNRSETAKASLREEAGHYLQRSGCLAVKGHGLSQAVIRSALLLMEQLFTGISEEDRLRYQCQDEGRQTGYTPAETERAVNQALPNLMGFWQVQDPEGGGKNVVPAELPEFGNSSLELLRGLKTVGEDVMRLLALSLGRPESFFRTWTLWGENLLRLIHCPALEGTEVGDRASPHTDICLLSLTVLTPGCGLQIQDASGDWVPISLPPGQILVTVGDMLEAHTFGVFRSVRSRITNPRREDPDRFLIQLFLHPRAGTALITSDGFRNHRLRQIGLLEPQVEGQLDY